MCKAADFSPEDYPRIMRDNRPRRYDRHSEVRYSVISDDDHKTVTLVVIGACTKLVHEVVAWMWAKGAGLIRKADVRTHLPLHFFNGKHRREIWVEIEPNLQKLGLSELCLLFEAQFCTRTDCTIQKIEFSKLINL